MKALIYKEFKLSMHIMCYIFVFAFPFMILIPNYPISIGFIYILSAYPILFLGANKGQQSNDLLFSTLLPVRKKDIVLARIFTLSAMLITFIIISSLLSPLAYLIQNAIPHDENMGAQEAGLGVENFIGMIGIVLIGFSIANAIFLPKYYKNGKSIIFPTLSSIIVFTIFISIFTIALIYIPGFEWYKEGLKNIWIQLGVLFAGILIYTISHIFIYKICAKRLEKVDF